MLKAVLKLLLVPLLLFVLLKQCEKYPEPVHIPDDAFLNALIELGVDKNGDGEICSCEAEEITFLNVNGKGISDMTGIEAFINLDTLLCGSVSDPDGPKLRILNVARNTALKYLNCASGRLTNLDVSHNTALKDFGCGGNQITSLDLSTNTAIISLDCNGNQLGSLDVSNNLALVILHCGWNQITELDFTNHLEFGALSCIDNPLTRLDLTNCPALMQLWCDKNLLTSLDISSNTALVELFLRDSPTLEEVCVWEMPFPPYAVSVDTEGSPNVYFTTECSR